MSTIRRVGANSVPDGAVIEAAAPRLSVFQSERSYANAAINQRKILIVVVDQLKADDPQLETIWLATYVNARSHITLLPLFPASLSGGERDDLAVKNGFKLDGDGQLSQGFLDQIQSKQIRWDNTFILDELGLAMLIDAVGGVDLGRGRVSGVRALSQIPLVQYDAQAALFAHAMLARSICRLSGDLVDQVEVQDLLQPLTAHMRSDLSEQFFVDEWQRLRNSKTGVSCEFPNLQKSSALP